MLCDFSNNMDRDLNAAINLERYGVKAIGSPLNIMDWEALALISVKVKPSSIKQVFNIIFSQ
jgi:transposase